MKVRCKKLEMEYPEGVFVHNTDMEGFISIGNIFTVFGLSIVKGICYLYVFNNEHLVEVPKDLFEIVDDKVSSQWIIKFWDDSDVTLWPKLFYEQNFLENFAEREEYERGLFINLRKMMEEEGN